MQIVKPRLHQRNMLRGNMLRWCKRGLIICIIQLLDQTSFDGIWNPPVCLLAFRIRAIQMYIYLLTYLLTYIYVGNYLHVAKFGDTDTN